MLNWLDISADETGYQIQGSEDGNSFENVAIVPANTTDFIWQIDSLSSSYQYFRVAAIGEACQSAYSNPVNLSLSTNTSLLNPVKNIVVFPNPTYGSFQLETAIPSVWIRIIDGFGKKWIEESHLQLTTRISMRNIPPGMYVIQVMDIHGQIWNKKIIRQ